MSKTKIVVIQLKEIVYTAIFVGLGILLILLLVFMFLPKGTGKTQNSQAQYVPGVYANQITLGETSLNVEVVVDESHIKDVSVTNLNDSITTMFPLVEPAIDEISDQLANNVAIKDIIISEDHKYTEMLLLQGVEGALEDAIPQK